MRKSAFFIYIAFIYTYFQRHVSFSQTGRLQFALPETQFLIVFLKQK